MKNYGSLEQIQEKLSKIERICERITRYSSNEPFNPDLYQTAEKMLVIIKRKKRKL